AAKELCEKGLKTLVLERGRHVEHGKDYITEWLQPWQLPHRGSGEQALYERDYPIQSKNYAFGETTRHFFVNDREHPYVTPDDQPFRWIRGYQLGGRSLIWGRLCWRWSDLDFEANLRDGHGVAWPTPGSPRASPSSVAARWSPRSARRSGPPASTPSSPSRDSQTTSHARSRRSTSCSTSRSSRTACRASSSSAWPLADR